MKLFSTLVAFLVLLVGGCTTPNSQPDQDYENINETINREFPGNKGTNPGPMEMLLVEGRWNEIDAELANELSRIPKRMKNRPDDEIFSEMLRVTRDYDRRHAK